MSEKNEFDKLAKEIAGNNEARKGKMKRLWDSLKDLKAEIGQISKEQKEMLANNKRFSEEARARAQEAQRINEEHYENMLAEIQAQNRELEGIVAVVSKRG